MRRIHVSKRKEKEAKRLRRKREAERAEKLGRYTGYLIALIVIFFVWFVEEINFINYYSGMSKFRENAQLVTARLVSAENYDKTIRGKYSRFEPPATKDMTLQFEWNGAEIIRTYENVYVWSSEANTDKYTHIQVYVSEDASDVQTKWVMDECMNDAKFYLAVEPLIGLGIWIAWVVFAENKIFKETRKGTKEGAL